MDSSIKKAYGVSLDNWIIDLGSKSFFLYIELKFILAVSGDQIIPLASSKDHKKLSNGDLGPNTGGMGAYSPTKLIDSKTTNMVIDKIIYPTLNELKKIGIEYKGFLYAGLMIDEYKNPFVLEYNWPNKLWISWKC